MLQPDQRPRYSDDGRWWWDGQRWLPTQPAVAGHDSGIFVQQAGFLLRFVAYLIDWVILIVGEVIVLVFFGLIGTAIDAATGPSSTAGSAVTSLLAGLIILVGSWLYFSLQESSARQATLGKLAVGIRVVDLESRRLTFGRATGRYFAKILSYMVCYVGFIMAAFTERKQALHDLVASTLVIRARPDSAQRLQPGVDSGAGAVILSIVAGVGILFLTSIVVVVILLTMGGQIKNVFSNVVVALNP